MNICMPGSYRQIRDETHVLVETFPDGETSIQVPVNCSGKDVFLYGHCATAVDSESFLAAAYEIACQGPKSFTIYNTYFRHARSERKAGDKAALAKFQARQWSGIGRVFPGVKMVFIDLHKDLILNYFEGAVVTKNVTCIPDLADYVFKTLRMTGDTVYATVDEGGVYAARKVAQEHGVGFAYIEKTRLSGAETVVRRVLGDSVEGRTVVILDDIISTGGSMAKAAEAYKAEGAVQIYAAATHGVFGEGALHTLRQSPIKAMLVTDSHPNARKACQEAPDFLGLVSWTYHSS